MDALVAVSCFEKIFRSAWRVLSAPKLKDLCAIDAGKKSLSLILKGDYGVDLKTAVQTRLKTTKAAYLSPTGTSLEPLQKKPKRKKLNLNKISSS